MSPVLTVRHGSETQSVTNATLVTVTVERNTAGKPTRLVASADPLIYWTRPDKQSSPGRSREVLWVSGNLAPGEELRIEPKEKQRRYFAWSGFALDEKHPAVNSGPIVKGMDLAREEIWSYNLVLYKNHLETKRLDPTVIIKEDP